jgi:hypothetical protein
MEATLTLRMQWMHKWSGCVDGRCSVHVWARLLQLDSPQWRNPLRAGGASPPTCMLISYFDTGLTHLLRQFRRPRGRRRQVWYSWSDWSQLCAHSRGGSPDARALIGPPRSSGVAVGEVVWQWVSTEKTGCVGYKCYYSDSWPQALLEHPGPRHQTSSTSFDTMVRLMLPKGGSGGGQHSIRAPTAAEPRGDQEGMRRRVCVLCRLKCAPRVERRLAANQTRSNHPYPSSMAPSPRRDCRKRRASSMQLSAADVPRVMAYLLSQDGCPRLALGGSCPCLMS